MNKGICTKYIRSPRTIKAGEMQQRVLVKQIVLHSARCIGSPGLHSCGWGRPTDCLGLSFPIVSWEQQGVVRESTLFSAEPQVQKEPWTSGPGTAADRLEGLGCRTSSCTGLYMAPPLAPSPFPILNNCPGVAVCRILVGALKSEVASGSLILVPGNFPWACSKGGPRDTRRGGGCFPACDMIK